MVGSLKDRVKLFISDSVMKNINVKTIKNIIETEIENQKKIMFLMMINYLKS